jgi:hypothetical protein
MLSLLKGKGVDKFKKEIFNELIKDDPYDPLCGKFNRRVTRQLLSSSLRK